MRFVRKPGKFALLLVAVAATITAGCGQDSRTSTGGASTTPADEVGQRLPASFGVLALAATDDWMVGVGPHPSGIDGQQSVRLVDLEHGGSKQVAAPVSGGVPVTIVDLIADGKSFVGIGYRCRGASGGEGCLGPQKLIRLDPATGSWTFEDVPVPAGAVVGSTLSAGHDLLVVESDRKAVTVVRRAANGTWTELAKIGSSSSPVSCVTATDLWLFSRSSGGSPDPRAGDTAYTLTRVDLSSGRTEAVELPDLADYFGGVTTEFGCGERAPFVASTPAGGVPPIDAETDELHDALTGVTVWEWTGRTWRRLHIDALDGHTVPDTIVSGPVPLLLGARMDVGTRPNRSIAVLLDDQGGRSLPTNGTDSYVWRGGTGDLLRLFDVGSHRSVATVTVGS